MLKILVELWLPPPDRAELTTPIEIRLKNAFQKIEVLSLRTLLEHLKNNGVDLVLFVNTTNQLVYQCEKELYPNDNIQPYPVVENVNPKELETCMERWFISVKGTNGDYDIPTQKTIVAWHEAELSVENITTAIETLIDEYWRKRFNQSSSDD